MQNEEHIKEQLKSNLTGLQNQITKDNKTIKNMKQEHSSFLE